MTNDESGHICEFCGAPIPAGHRPHLSLSECNAWLKRELEAARAANETLRMRLVVAGTAAAIEVDGLREEIAELKQYEISELSARRSSAMRGLTA